MNKSDNLRWKQKLSMSMPYPAHIESKVHNGQTYTLVKSSPLSIMLGLKSPPVAIDVL